MFQKFFATLLTYVIGFQLIASSVPHSSLSMTAWAGSCDSGLQWNELLGRCLTSEEAAKIKEANAQCMQLGTSDAQKKCLNDALLARVQDAENKGEIYAHQKVNPNIVSIILAMAGIWAGFQMSIKGSGDCLMAYSKWSFIIASLAVMAGEILSAMTYKSKMKEAEKEVKKENDSSAGTASDNQNATDTQSASFTSLIKREEATISAGNTKKMLYTVATVAHGVGLAIATYEIIAYHAQMVCPGPCGSLTMQYMCTTASADATQPGMYKHYANRDQQNAELFVDNYFLKNQRVSYSTYTESDSMFNEIALSTADLALYNLESRALFAGKNISPELSVYTSMVKIVKDNNLELDKETITFSAVAEKMIEQFMVTNAHAEGEGLSLILGAAGAGGVALIAGSGMTLKNMFYSPYTRLILAGVFMANDIFMISHISKQIEKAEERKEFIEKLQQQVTASGSAFDCTSSDRSSNMAKPLCYCYSEGGTLNPARSNSATCAQFFGSKPNLASKKTNSSNTASTNKACMTKSGGYDGSCSCVRTKTCATVKTDFKGNPIAGGLLGNLPSTVNGLTNGTMSAADINSAQLNGLAARAKKFQEDLLAKNPKMAGTISKAKSDGLKLMDKMRNSIASNPGLANASSGSMGSFDSSNPSKALEQMKDELKQEIRAIDGGNAIPLAGGGAGKKSDDFNLDALAGSEGGVKIEDEKLAEVMGSEYDMSAGEINGDSGANIFQILSNRYQRSGMRRLFGGEALVPADKPSDKQISQ